MLKTRSIAWVTIGAAAWSGGTFAHGQITQDQRITPTPRLTSQIFGLALSFDGTTIAVGACFENQPASLAGAVYLFQRPGQTWTQTLRLHGPTPQAADFFGIGVAVAGDTLLSSAGGRTSGGVAGAGALYIYQNQAGTWALSDTLGPSNPIVDGSFGDPLVMSGDVAVAGAWLSAFPQAGGFADREAYILERAGGVWTETARLPAPASYSNGFTASAGAAISSEEALIGGSRELLNDQPIGAVFAYQRSGGGWQPGVTIRPADLPVSAYFGQTVALSGDVLAVGAPQDTINGHIRAGSVYLFRKINGAWTQFRKLTAPTPAARDFFGVGLALNGNRLLVGAYQSEIQQPFQRRGYACLYYISGDDVSDAITITAGDGAPHDIFGWRCALHGERAVVTAPFHTLNQGAAYVYSGVETPCEGDVDGDARVGLSDLTILLGQFGESGAILLGDLDGDGSVGLNDLTILLSRFGASC